jgi:hypothetical protein
VRRAASAAPPGVMLASASSEELISIRSAGHRVVGPARPARVCLFAAVVAAASPRPLVRPQQPLSQAEPWIGAGTHRNTCEPDPRPSMCGSALKLKLASCNTLF